MERYKLEVGAFYFNGNGVLFTGFSCNRLFYWDIAENKTFILGEFDKDSVWSRYMSYVTVRRKNNFFFLPYMAHGIPYFNVDTKEIRYCNMPGCLDNKILNYYGYIEKDNLIYLFPMNLSENILVLDMDQKNIAKVFPEWNRNIIKSNKIKNTQLMNGFSYRENRIWISYSQAEGIFEIVPDSWNTQFHIWKEIAHPIILNTNDNGLWIEDQGEASVYHINTSEEIIEQYKLEEKSNYGAKLFDSVLKLSSGVNMVLPGFSNVILIIDIDHSVHCCNIEKNIDGIDGNYLCHHYLEFDEEVWLLPHSQQDIIIVNLKNYNIKLKKLPEPDDWIEISNYILKMQRCESSCMMQENLDNITLMDFCDYVDGKKEKMIEKNTVEGYGKEIWREVKKW